MSKKPLIVKWALRVTLGVAAVWALPVSAEAQADKPAAKPAAKDQKGDKGSDLNKEVEDALKELEKLNTPPAQQPRFQGGGGNGIGNGNIDQQALQRQILMMRMQLGGGAGGNRPAPQQPNQGRFGLVFQKPSPVLSQQLRLPEGQGQIVADLRADSPAEKAGFQKNDVILELNGKAVSSDINVFLQDVRDIKSGTKFDAVVLRQGQKETLKNIVLPEANALENLPQQQPRRAAGGGLGGLGLGGIGGIGGMGGIGGLQMQLQQIQQMRELQLKMMELDNGLLPPGLDLEQLLPGLQPNANPIPAPQPAPQKKKGPEVF